MKRIKWWHVTFIAFSILVAYVFRLWLLPHTYFFEYKSVEPIVPMYCVLQRPEFESKADIKRPVKLVRVDRIRCDADYDWKLSPFMVATDTNKYEKPKTIDNTRLFGTIADKAIENCKIQSIITAKMPLWLDKTQVVRSKNRFEFCWSSCCKE